MTALTVHSICTPVHTHYTDGKLMGSRLPNISSTVFREKLADFSSVMCDIKFITTISPSCNALQ
jgi:hypothetical protein